MSTLVESFLVDSYKGTVKEFLQQLKLTAGSQQLMYKVTGAVCGCVLTCTSSDVLCSVGCCTGVPLLQKREGFPPPVCEDHHAECFG